MKQLNWYQIFGKSNIPDGRTVLPTDDIQIWLNCANIWDKSYTTLAEVLADTDTLSALINSENAVDYMVRSTTWAVTITVPAMTGYTTPSGKAFSSGNPTNHECWQAFSGKVTQNGTDNWEKSFSSGDYIGYTFTQSVCVHLIKLTNPMWNTTVAARSVRNFKLQGSNDENTWTDIASYTNEQVLEKLFAVSNTDSYTSYRLYITSNYGNQYVLVDELQFYSLSITSDSTAMSYIGLNNYCANTLLADATWCEAICNSEYFESVLNVRIPVMTSNNTPNGVASATSVYSSAYAAYRAFMGNDIALDNDSGWVSASGVASADLLYQTDSDATFKPLFMKVSRLADNITNFTFYVSNDGNTYTNLLTVTSMPLRTVNNYWVSAETKYRYFKWAFSSNTNLSGGSGIKIRLYGREDV